MGRPPARLGQHTDEVLGEAGFGADEIVKLRDLQDVTSIVVTHQIRDAVYVATHKAVQQDGKLAIEEAALGSDEVQFLVLREGRIHFAGTQEELLANPDAYLKEFLYMTLPPW